MAYHSDDLMRLVQQTHTDEVTALEADITRRATGDTDAQFNQLARRALAAWTAAFGSVTALSQPGDALNQLVGIMRAAVRRLLTALSARAATALQSTLAHAIRLGTRQGAAFLRAATGTTHAAPTLRASRDLAAEAARVTVVVAERLDRALAMLRPDRLPRWPNLLTGIGVASSALSAVAGHVAWTVGRAVDQGLAEVARVSPASGRVWVAEADACVRCLAYSGRITGERTGFPGGLSWDPQQRRPHTARIDGPPLHPHCRCRAVPWDDRWATTGTSFPLALQREAQRSIVYTPGRRGESRAARVRAVRALLASGAELLPAVEARARTVARTGRFPAAA